MKATKGRSVIVIGIPSNGEDNHPALITRAWSDRDTAEGPVCVNLTVFPDCAAPMSQGSVMLFDTEDLALAHRALQPHSIVAHWPSRA